MKKTNIIMFIAILMVIYVVMYLFIMKPSISVGNFSSMNTRPPSGSTTTSAQSVSISTSTPDISGWLTYSDPGHGYQLKYPLGAQEIIIENSSSGPSAIRFQLEKTIGAPYPLQDNEGQLSLLAFYITATKEPGITLQNWINQVISERGFNGKVLNNQMSVAGVPAESIGIPNGDGLIQVYIYVINRGLGYRISGIEASSITQEQCAAVGICSIVSYVRQYEPYFNAMLNSFAFTASSSLQ